MHLMNTYGITVEQYEHMLKAQNNHCAICNVAVSEHMKELCVDHDHQNGNIRGLLCNPCNKAVGLMRDHPGLLKRAAEYLEDYHDRLSKASNI